MDQHCCFDGSFHNDGCPLLAQIEELLAKLHACEVERDAALFQLREQNQRLDAATMTIEIMRDDL